jgi:hypothetical protein
MYKYVDLDLCNLCSDFIYIVQWHSGWHIYVGCIW